MICLSPARSVTLFTMDDTDRDFYFVASDKYLGDNRAAYYQSMTFTLSHRPANQSTSGNRDNQTTTAQRHYVILAGVKPDLQLW